jgi:hypothetical protein
MFLPDDRVILCCQVLGVYYSEGDVRRRVMSIGLRTVIISLGIAGIFGCTQDVPKEVSINEVKGACADIHNSQVCTWAKMQGETLLEVGATVPVGSIENAPADTTMVWPPVPIATLDIPEAARQKSGLMNLTVFWEPHGHPTPTFLTPHFDFHFNQISAAELNAIDCKDLTKPASIPAGYALPDFDLPPDASKMMGVKTMVGLCVPKMGMHSVPSADVDRKDPFEASMIVGYNIGKPIFFEPMISKALLMQKKSFDLATPTVPGLTGPQPTKFHAEYDAEKQEYRMILSGFSAGS